MNKMSIQWSIVQPSKKNEVLIHAASYTHAKRKKPDTKDHIFYDSLDISEMSRTGKSKVMGNR